MFGFDAYLPQKNIIACNAQKGLRSLENGSMREMPPDFSREGQRHKDTHALRFGRECIARAGGVEKAIRFGQPLSACPSAMDGMRRDAGRVHFPRVSVSSPGAERCRVLGHGAIQGALTAMRVFWIATQRYVLWRMGA